MAPQALLSGCWFYTPLRISIGTKTVGGFRLPTALLITLQFSLLILYLYWQCNHTTSCIHSYSIDIGPLYLRYKRKQYFLVLGQPRHIQKTQGGTTGNMMKTLYPRLLLKLLPSQPEASWAMLMPRCIRFWALCPATWQQDLDVRYRWCVEPLRVHMHHSNSFPTLKGDDFGKLHEPPFFDAKFLAWLWHPVFWCFWMLLGELSWLPYQRISRVAHRVAMELNCLTLHLSIHSIEFLFRSIQLLLFLLQHTLRLPSFKTVPSFLPPTLSSSFHRALPPGLVCAFGIFGAQFRFGIYGKKVCSSHESRMAPSECTVFQV